MFENIFALPDATIYFFMGATGSVLFLLRVAMLLLFGVDDGGDFSVGDGDFDAGGGADFHLFSLLSIVSFMMGMGWMGLACRLEWQLGSLVSAFSALGFGFFLMFLSSAGMYSMKRMNTAGVYDVSKCIGHTGEVYLQIPAKGEGAGQVRINVDGRTSVMRAVSTGEALPSFTAVVVKELQDDRRTLVVERA